MIGVIDCRSQSSGKSWADLQPEMLEFFDRPLLQHAVEQMVQNGVNHCVLITEDTSAVMQRWGTGERWGCTFSAIQPYSITSFLMGLGDQPLMVGRGDCIPCMTGLLPQAQASEPTMLIFRESMEGQARTRIFTGWAITTPKTLLEQCFATYGSAGLASTPNSTAIQVATCIRSDTPGAFLLSQHTILEAVESAVIFHGMEMRPGVWAARGAVLHPSVKTAGKVFLGDNVRVGRGVTLRGPVVICRDSAVDAHAVISNSSVQSGTYVGRGVNLEHSVAMPGTIIKAQQDVAFKVQDPRLLASTDLTLWSYLKLLSRAIRTKTAL